MTVSIATVAAITFAIIRAFNQPALQEKLHLAIRWKWWPGWLQMATIFGLSMISAVVTAIIGNPGASAEFILGKAIEIALGGSFGAISIHETTKAIGSKTTEPGKEQGSIRTMVSPLLPIDQKKVVSPLYASSGRNPKA